MKKLLFFAFILPLFVFAFDFGGSYNFNYFYMYEKNYFSNNIVTLNCTIERDYAKLFIQGNGIYYNGIARYYITYPKVDHFAMDYFPEYITLNNEVNLTQIYISVFAGGLNFKLGRIPLKISVSEIYSPIEFTDKIPFNVFYSEMGLNGFSLSYSKSDWTFFVFYNDAQSFEKAKQYIEIENTNKFAALSLYALHYFDFRNSLFRNETFEYYGIGSSGISDYFGFGLWYEANYLYSKERPIKYILFGVDYTFYDKLYAQLEYHHNFNGIESPFSDITHINKLLNMDFFIGKDYLFALLKYEISKKWENAVISSINLNDRSFMNAAYLKYNFRDFLSFSLYSVFSIGHETSDFVKMPPIFIFRAEYIF